MVTLEESEERSLGSGCSLNSTESNIIASTLDVPKVPEKLLRSEKDEHRESADVSLSVSCSLATAASHPTATATHLDPEGGPLTDGSELSGLEVGPSEDGEVLLLLGELAQPLDDDGELGEDDIASIPKEDEVGVVRHVA